jgi:hypothetical protein
MPAGRDSAACGHGGAVVKVYYFGCVGGLGHYFHDGALRRVHGAKTEIPWPNVDAALCPGYVDPMLPGTWRTEAPQIEGAAAVHHKAGWTALAFWDRSVDTRGGSNSVFFVEGTHNFAAMVVIARQRFPSVWARFTFPVTLAGAEPPCPS